MGTTSATQIAAKRFARVWQKDAQGEGQKCFLVAMFLLDVDAAEWVEEQNKRCAADGELYFYNPGEHS